MNESDHGSLAVARQWCWVAFALLAASPLAAQPIDLVVNGEALVRLVETADIATFNGRYQTTTLREIPSRQIYLVALDPGGDPDEFKTAAAADPDTVWVELNYYGQVPEARGRCFYTTGGPDAQQYLDQPAWDQIGLPGAAAQSTGDGIVIAVVDSGIDATHITLANAVLPGGWNFVDDTADTADVGDGIDNDGDGDIDEMTGHGTHVAGIIRKVAPDAWMLPIKVLDSEGNSDNFILAAGIFHAIDQQVDVINVSVGSTYNSEGVLDAVLEAQSLGIVVVAAGGNADTHLPEEYPALNQGVIGVASVNEIDVKGWFSNWHENFVINTPGEQIFSTFPGDIYASWDGTSMSAPMVSGVTALLLTRRPEWPRDQSRVNNVRIALVQSADNVDDLNPDYAGMLGAGRLNAARALDDVGSFAAPVRYPVGSAPEAVAAGDFDGDGLADLAVTNMLSNTVSVLLHDAVATFEPAIAYATGLGPSDVEAGRFDADAHVDLAVLNEDAGTFSILAGIGDGTFGVPVSYPAGGDASAFAAGDLNGDEHPDLAVACDDLGSVVVHLNDGQGAFTVSGAFAVGARPRDVVIADVDQDGQLDLVSANRNSDTISVLLNRGDATFLPAAHYAVGIDPRALVVADFNGDANPDIAVANHDSGDISVLWNSGAGMFGSPMTIGFSDGRRPERLAAADLDCDGDVELVASAADSALSSVSIFLNRGDGTFFGPVDYAVGANPTGVAAADLDGDLDRDLAVVSTGDNTVATLLNESSEFCGDGLFGDLDGDCEVGLSDLARLLANYGASAGAVYATGDLDKDGDVDLADLASLLGEYGAVCG